jgi:serine protease Do
MTAPRLPARSLLAALLLATLAGRAPRSHAQTPVSLEPSPEAAAVLAARAPVDVDDLRLIQDQLKRVLSRALPATASVEIGNAAGSGVVVSADGLVLTAAHVIGGPGRRAYIELPDGRRLRGTTLGADHDADAGMVRIDNPPVDLPFTPVAADETLEPGAWVVTTGQPGGLVEGRAPPVRLGRVLFRDDELLCTDCKLVGGDSGGPLFNMRGEVVGVNSQIYSRTGGFMGLSFAIPIDVANDIAQQLRTTGKVTRGRIGVVIQPVTKELADGFGLPRQQGALVNSVEKGGPADKAGIEAGDVILRFDGKPVNSSEDLPRMVGATKPGSKAAIQLWRNKQAREVQVVIGEMPDERAARQSRRGGKPPAATPSQYGLTLSELSETQRGELKIAGGVLVENAQGAAARAGIRRGDVILAVNNQDVKSVEQFNQMMGQFDKGRIVALLVRRGSNSLYIPFRVEGN